MIRKFSHLLHKMSLVFFLEQTCYCTRGPLSKALGVDGGLTKRYLLESIVHRWERSVCVMMIVGIFVLLGADVPAVQAATAYYVAPDGTDTNPGTLAAPFRTLQKCADVALAGDTCLVRAGVYRETVTLPRSGAAGAPITFKAYNGEAVTISGADVVTGWSIHTGQIYRAPMGWSLNVRQGSPSYQITNDQVFVDGQMMPEARWPNIPPSVVTRLSNAYNARAASASVANTYTATYSDPALNGFASNFWQGAKINFVPGWKAVSATCDVTGSAPGSVAFQCNPDPAADGARFTWDDQVGSKYRPSAGNPYFLWGKLQALDAPGEWFRDAAGTLYLWAPDGASPAVHSVEARRRLWAFDARGKDYISLEGLTLFAATVRTDSNTDHLLLQSLSAQYLWHFQQIPPRWAKNGIAGLDFTGNDNVIRDSVVAYSAGQLLWFGGRRNEAYNNTLYDGGYTAYLPAVRTTFPSASNPAGADKNRLRQNTLLNSGNIQVEAGPGLDILYNDVYSSHLQISDLGVIYSWNTDGLGAAIGYNLVHDNWAELNRDLNFYGGYGIFLDEDTRNYTTYRNVTWNTTADGIFVFGSDPAQYPNSSRRFYNNTVDGTIGAHAKSSPSQTLTGVEFRNNYAAAFGVYDFSEPGLALQNNRIEELVVVDRTGRDYRLRSGSPAIDAGANLPGYTDGYAGSAPDVGALESGQVAFVAGALLREQDLANLSVQCVAGPGDTADCTIGGMPLGRKLPNDFQVRIGAGGTPAQNCLTRMDYSTHLGAGLCSGVSTAGLSGLQPIYVRLGAGAWADTGATADLRAFAVTGVAPSVGFAAGGATVTVTGRRFASDFWVYRAPVTLNNPTGSALYNYQVLVTMNTAGLVTAGKLRADCGDLRFRDSQGELPYWLEEGCNTAATRVWVKVPVVPAGSSQIEVRYGTGAPGASDGRRTFAFFDDFSDGVLDPSYWSAQTGAWFSVAEAGGALKLSGATSAATIYEQFFVYLRMSNVFAPASFAIDSLLSMVPPSTAAGFKLAAGSDDLRLFGLTGNVKNLGYWQSGAGWIDLGDSTINAANFTDKKISLAVTGPTNSRTLRWFENGDAATVRAARSGLDSPALGTFAFGPDAVAAFDVRFDDVRVRNYAYPEPTASLGAETASPARVSFGGQTCTNVVVLDSATLTCTLPAHPAGKVDVMVTNPDGQTGSLSQAFEYVTGLRVYLPLIRR